MTIIPVHLEQEQYHNRFMIMAERLPTDLMRNLSILIYNEEYTLKELFNIFKSRKETSINSIYIFIEEIIRMEDARLFKVVMVDTKYEDGTVKDILTHIHRITKLVIHLEVFSIFKCILSNEYKALWGDVFDYNQVNYNKLNKLVFNYCPELIYKRYYQKEEVYKMEPFINDFKFDLEKFMSNFFWPQSFDAFIGFLEIYKGKLNNIRDENFSNFVSVYFHDDQKAILNERKEILSKNNFLSLSMIHNLSIGEIKNLLEEGIVVLKRREYRYHGENKNLIPSAEKILFLKNNGIYLDRSVVKSYFDKYPNDFYKIIDKKWYKPFDNCLYYALSSNNFSLLKKLYSTDQTIGQMDLFFNLPFLYDKTNDETIKILKYFSKTNYVKNINLIKMVIQNDNDYIFSHIYNNIFMKKNYNFEKMIKNSYFYCPKIEKLIAN